MPLFNHQANGNQSNKAVFYIAMQISTTPFGDSFLQITEHLVETQRSAILEKITWDCSAGRETTA